MSLLHFSAADLETLPFTLTFALIDTENQTHEQKHGVSASQSDGFFIDGELRVNLNAANKSLDKLKLDRASNVRGLLEVAVIADASGFQMVQIAELNPIEALDLSKESQPTTLWFSEDDVTQPCHVFIEPSTKSKSRAGRITGVRIRVDWSVLPRTLEHVRRYSVFFATRFNQRTVRLLDDVAADRSRLLVAAAAAADEDESVAKKRKVVSNFAVTAAAAAHDDD